LNIESQDLPKFHEFNLKENYNKIKITRKNKKEESYPDRVPFVVYYSLTDTDFLYQEYFEWTVAWEWFIEDGWVDRFRKRIKRELKANEYPEIEREGKEENKLQYEGDYSLSKLTPQEIEQLRNLKVYKSYKGKEYTFDEWSKYEKEQWEIYIKKKNLSESKE
jgi:hypothetical protein